MNPGDAGSGQSGLNTTSSANSPATEPELELKSG